MGLPRRRLSASGGRRKRDHLAGGGPASASARFKRGIRGKCTVPPKGWALRRSAGSDRVQRLAK